MLYIKTCIMCNKEYEAKRSDSKTCSKKCRQNMSKRKQRKSFKNKICAHCFTEFEGPNNALYCSEECSNIEQKIKRLTTTLENKAIISALKEDGCSVCGGKFENVQLDLHHLSGKEESIGPLMRGYSIKLMEEIKKCIVVCANCHRKITHGNTFTVLGIKFEN